MAFDAPWTQGLAEPAAWSQGEDRGVDHGHLIHLDACSSGYWHSWR